MEDHRLGVFKHRMIRIFESKKVTEVGDEMKVRWVRFVARISNGKYEGSRLFGRLSPRGEIVLIFILRENIK
jgi:hypothetical protein